MFTLPPLPYAKEALEPHIMARTVTIHHEKHHQAYVTNLNNLIENTEFAGKSLEDIIKASVSNPDHVGIFNNAAQVWNHTFYWHSMQPNGANLPTGALLSAMERDFGSVDTAVAELKKAAMTQFGSGWAWLVSDKSGKLSVQKTGNAGTPLTTEFTALLTVDVWEHAYYLDFQNMRASYLDAFFAHLANWEFAAANYKSVVA
jgi:Fe-Mn family superoxide dismutase